MNVTTKTTALIRADSGHRLSLQPPEHRAYPSQPRGPAGSAVALTGEEYVRLLHPDGRKGSATIAQKIPVPQQGGPGWTQHAVRIADLPEEAASLAGVPDVYVTPNSSGASASPSAWRSSARPSPTSTTTGSPAGANAAPRP